MVHVIKFKNDANYRYLCDNTLINCTGNASTPIHFLRAWAIQNGLYLDDYAGQTVRALMADAVGVSGGIPADEVVKIAWFVAGAENPTVAAANALLDLVLFGDGKCPECGCDCDFVDGYEKQATYYQPSEMVWERFKCEQCGCEFEVRDYKTIML